jgi:hypothetical protein
MSNGRCFFERTPKLNSSERSLQLSQKVIYCDLSNNLVKLNTSNPKKKNGFQYNDKAKVEPTFCITNAESYQTLRRVRNGQQLMTKTPPVANSIYNGWNANTYHVNYGNIPVVVNGVIDPSYQIFYDKCNENDYNDNQNRPVTWLTNVVTEVALNANTNPF